MDEEDEQNDDNSVAQENDNSGGISDVYVTEFVKSMLQLDVEQNGSDDTSSNPDTGDDGSLMGMSLPCCVVLVLFDLFHVTS